MQQKLLKVFAGGILVKSHQFTDPKVDIFSLKEGIENESDTNLVLAFADPSTLPEYPGWPLRNLLALIAKKCPEKLQNGLRVLCYRQKAVIGGQLEINSSKVITVILETTDGSKFYQTFLCQVIILECRDNF